MTEASGIILAGGASRRMGHDKAWVELGGRALVRRVMDRLGTVCREIVIVANNQEPYRQLDARLTSDIVPGKGSLGGIYSGLSVARYEHAVVVACDMPFLNTSLLAYMLSLAGEADVVIPSARDASRSPKPSGPEEARAGRMGVSRGTPELEHRKNKPQPANRPTAKDSDLHPLHAVYSRRCLDPIAARLNSDDLRMISFYPEVRVRVVSTAEVDRFDPRHLSLFNVNTPEQLALAETWLEQV